MTRSDKEDLRSGLIAFAKMAFENEEIYSRIAKVISVNESEKTVKAQVVDGAIMPDIRLQQVENDSGLFIKPKTESMIIISYTDNVTAYVSMFSEIDEIVFQNGTNGGLTKISELVDKVNRLEDKLKSHQHGYIPYPSGSPATPVTTTPATALIPPDTTLVFTNTTVSDLENDKFKH